VTHAFSTVSSGPASPTSPGRRTHSARAPTNLALIGPARPTRKAVARSRIGDVQVTVWYFAGCPNWRGGGQRLRQALDVIGRGDADVRLVPVTSETEAAEVGFAGSPVCPTLMTWWPHLPRR
jgi:hypothetical protein